MNFQLCFMLLATLYLRAAASDPKIQPPRQVIISGYNDDAMEPFISRDGRYLLFNNLNDPATNTDIHFAERVDDFLWHYRGKVKGVNTFSFKFAVRQKGWC